MDTEKPILIADSDDNAVARLKQALAEVGFNNPFHVSTSGQDVLDYLQGNGKYGDRTRYPFPIMLIMELDLPVVDALAILCWVRQHAECSVLPVLILSASARPEEVTTAYRLGVNGYLQKAPTYDGLVNTMRRVFDFWQMSEIPPLPKNC